jgi:hypothetical protein
MSVPSTQWRLAAREGKPNAILFGLSFQLGSCPSRARKRACVDHCEQALALVTRPVSAMGIFTPAMHHVMSNAGAVKRQ